MDIGRVGQARLDPSAIHDDTKFAPQMASGRHRCGHCKTETRSRQARTSRRGQGEANQAHGGRCDMSATIQSIGPPPERHADRVVAEMMHAFARRYATLMNEVAALIGSANDGGRRGQLKLLNAIKRLPVMTAYLRPGKRGRYKIFFYCFTGWDYRRHDLIKVDDPVLERPWIACHLCLLESFGGGRKYRELSAHPIVLISHHALSRAAQRLKLREIEAIPVIAESILDAAVNLLLEKKTLAAWLAAPPQGWRVTIAEDDSRSEEPRGG